MKRHGCPAAGRKPPQARQRAIVPRTTAANSANHSRARLEHSKFFKHRKHVTCASLLRRCCCSFAVGVPWYLRLIDHLHIFACLLLSQCGTGQGYCGIVCHTCALLTLLWSTCPPGATSKVGSLCHRPACCTCASEYCCLQMSESVCCKATGQYIQDTLTRAHQRC